MNASWHTPQLLKSGNVSVNLQLINPSLDLGEYIKLVEAYDPSRGGVLFALGDSSMQHLESSDFGQTWLQTEVNRFQQENASSPSFAPSDILAVSIGQLPESMVKCVHLHSAWEG